MASSTTRPPIDFSPGRRSVDAPDHVRAAVHALLVGQMAGHLCDHQIDLTNRSAARASLERAGFGEPSVERLLDRAISEAGRSIAFLEANRDA